MKFTRVNNNTICCQISAEEMTRKGIRIDDIMGDRGKAEAFLQDVLTEARQEVNFDTSGDALNVQLSVMKNGTVNLQITNDRNASIRLLLEQIKQRLQLFQNQLAASSIPPENVLEIPPNGSYAVSSSAEKVRLAGNDDIITMHVWAIMDSMEDCIGLSKTLVKGEPIPSALYSFNDAYYYELDLAQKKSIIAKTIFSISEYSDKVFSDEGLFMEVKEHGKRLIKEEAIEKLARL